MALNPKLADWHGRVVWLVGASSGIGRALAHELHQRGAVVALSARNVEALRSFVAEHPGSVALPLDASDVNAMRAAARKLIQTSGQIDLAIYCAGHYKAQRATNFNLQEMLRHQSINYVGALHMLEAVLPAFNQSQRGHISLISSVAGFRGLPNSLAYGPTKAALGNLAETLYLDLHQHNIGVSVINPGFVETPLTAQNKFSMPALITPQVAAQNILRGWARGDFQMNFPKRFTIWLSLLRHLPDTLYFALIRRALQT